MNIACLNFFQIIMKHFCHRGTCYIGTLLRKTAVCQVTACMLGIRKVHITDNVYNTAVGFFRQTLILAAVSCFHMEDWNVQSLCTDNT